MPIFGYDNFSMCKLCAMTWHFVGIQEKTKAGRLTKELSSSRPSLSDPIPGIPLPPPGPKLSQGAGARELLLLSPDHTQETPAAGNTLLTLNQSSKKLFTILSWLSWPTIFPDHTQETPAAGNTLLTLNRSSKKFSFKILSWLWWIYKVEAVFNIFTLIQAECPN